MTYQYIIKSVRCSFSPIYVRRVTSLSALHHPYIWDINVSQGNEKQRLLWHFSDRSSWINYILFTNLMH